MSRLARCAEGLRGESRRIRASVVLCCLSLLAAAWSPAFLREMLPRPAEFFYLYAAIGLGPWYGLLAALSSTLPQWIGPCALCPAAGTLLVTGEALAIGYLCRRYVSGARAALLFWIPIGIPVFLLRPELAHFPVAPHWLAALASASSGFLTTLAAAQLARNCPSCRWLNHSGPAPRRPLRSAVLNAILLTTGLTVFVVTVIHGELFKRDAGEELTRQLHSQAQMTGQEVEAYFTAHSAVIQSLAVFAGQLSEWDEPALCRLLARHHQTNPGFITMLVAGTDGTILASSPATTSDGRDLHQVRFSIADRDYFRKTIATRKPHISNAFRGRGFGQDPIVAISAPVFDAAGHLRGIVEGSLNLNSLQRLEPVRQDDGKVSLVILDPSSTVVYRSVDMPFAPLANAASSRLLQSARSSRQAVFEYQKLCGDSALIILARVPGLGWNVLLARSLAPVEARLSRHRAIALLVLMLALFNSLLFADIIGSRFARPLEILAREVNDFDFDRAGKVLAEPATASTEVASVISHWNLLTSRLQESYETLRLQMSEVERARQTAQAADDSKTRFLANMSHELRTPLNGIIGMSELLLRDSLSADQLEQMRTMRRSADSLLRMIDDILEIARLETGKLEIRRAPFRFRQVLRDVFSLHRPQAEEKGLDFRMVVPDSVPEWLSGDSTRLREVLTNLLGNAVKFTFAGRVLAEVGRQPTTDGAIWLEFRVSDTGIGIPPAAQSRLFLPFSQVDNASSRRFGGTGLGLAISRQLVELMGGSIQVSSVPEQGTVFTFSLPFALAQPQSEQPPDIEFHRPLEGVRVLVAEDHPVNRLVAKRLLEKLGYRVDLAFDGEAAVNAARQARYSAILMDCQMPNKDGYQATAEIRRQDSGHVPILAMTANAFPEDRLRCLEAGMDDYLAKPLELASLAAMLERWTTESESDWTAKPA